jgi:hypothetical protein
MRVTRRFKAALRDEDKLVFDPGDNSYFSGESEGHNAKVEELVPDGAGAYYLFIALGWPRRPFAMVHSSHFRRMIGCIAIKVVLQQGLNPEPADVVQPFVVSRRPYAEGCYGDDDEEEDREPVSASVAPVKVTWTERRPYIEFQTIEFENGAPE